MKRSGPVRARDPRSSRIRHRQGARAPKCGVGANRSRERVPGHQAYDGQRFV